MADRSEIREDAERALAADPIPMTAERARRALLAKIGALELAGHTVTLTGDIPGLFRVDNGPELTTNQLLALPL